MGNNNIDSFHIGTRSMENHQKPKPVYFRHRPTGHQLSNYMSARVEKLKQLYEEVTPKTTHKWVMPKGETDGRKAKKIETIVGKDISPFDLLDFEDRMPSVEDYCNGEE